MFKKLLVANVILALTTGAAFAANYKGERENYKDVVAPCPGYNPPVAPYLGLGIGVRTNWSSVSRVFEGFNGNVAAGYGGMVNPSWYLAGEIYVNGTIKIKDYEFPENSVRSTWDVGLSIIPGFKVNNDVLGFVRLGVVRTRFSKISENETGGVVGIGGQTNLMDNWDVRAEYDYSYYGHTKLAGHPQSNAVNVGLIYRFM